MSARVVKEGFSEEVALRRHWIEEKELPIPEAQKRTIPVSSKSWYQSLKGKRQQKAGIKGRYGNPTGEEPPRIFWKQKNESCLGFFFPSPWGVMESSQQDME